MFTRCRLEELQHAQAVWLQILPAVDIPHCEQVPDAKHSSLYLNIIDNEACAIIPVSK